MFLNQNNSKH